MRKLDKSLFAIFFLVLMRLASAPSANLSYLLLAVFALTGRAQAIQALALSWLFTFLSSGIAANATFSSIGRYAVIAFAALSIIMRSNIFSGSLVLKKSVAVTSMLGIFFLAHSFLFSAVPDVSILKSFSWLVVVATLLSAWSGLSKKEQDKLAKQLFIGLITILILSLPLLAHPLGYLRNGSGFQGILSHPQSFGPTMALLGAWTVSGIFAVTRPPLLSFVLLGACLMMVLLSEARTAGIALVLAMILSVSTVRILSGRKLRYVLPGLRSKWLWLSFFFVAIVGIIMAPNIGDAVHNYVTKSGRAEVSGLLEAYDRSRGGLIDEMWDNIREKPLTGIGFGIASVPSEMKIDRVLNIPVGATIEKGVMPVAVLEETGLFSFILVGIWIGMLIRYSARGGVTPLALACTVLLLNFGEAVLFSPGGMGMLYLIILTWAAASGKQSSVVKKYG